MADCDATLRELYTFLDGELPAAASTTIGAHLDDCHDCLQAFDFYAELRTVIAAKCRTDRMPPGLMARIEACFGPDPESRTNRSATSGPRGEGGYPGSTG